MRTVKYILLSIVGILGVGCTEQRDLYTKAQPMVDVINDWDLARINARVDGATHMFYGRSNPKEWIQSNPYRNSYYFPEGTYDVLVFNGLFDREGRQMLANISIEGSGDFETIRAVVSEMPLAKQFRTRAGDVVVDFPDTMAIRSFPRKYISDESQYMLKYKNGKGSYPSGTNYLADSVQMTACRITHICEVYVHTINAKSINGLGVVKASLRGFVQKTYLAKRREETSGAVRYLREPDPTSYVTHQFNLNHLRYDQGSTTDGTIQAIFSTFGPPFEDTSRVYELQIDVRYPSGKEQQFDFDVTGQLTAQIARMRAQRDANKSISDNIIIRIEMELELELGNWDVNLKDWGDDIIIVVPFGL